jgi:phage terminase large subunit-like protein
VWRIHREALEGLPAAERAQAAAALEALEEAVRRNPLVAYRPHRKQRTFHGARTPVKAFLGGNRSGKTTGGILDDLIQAVDGDVLPDELQAFKRWQPPFFARIVTPDFTSTMEGVVFAKLRDWTPKGQLLGSSWDKAYDKQQRILNFKNGSWFQFMTFEQDLDKFGGAALHRVHYDEEPPRLIRQECMFRLIDFDGDELFTMTPLHGMSWMFDEIYEPWERGDREGLTIVVVDMDDNPFLNQAAKARVLSGLSREERAARKSGRFVQFAGMVYGEFSRMSHVIPQSPVPGDALVLGSIDPGTRHMAAVVWAYLTAEDDLVVFEELALKEGTVAEVCRAIRMIEAQYQIRPGMYMIDPAARNIMHQTGRSDQMEYTDHGIVTILGQNAVTAGINRIKERLQGQPGQPPRLHVMANCTSLIEEFRRYHWAKQGRSEHEAKEVVVKRDDHLLDALRYLVMSRPVRPDRLREERWMDPMNRAAFNERSGHRRRYPPRSSEYGAIFS